MRVLPKPEIHEKHLCYASAYKAGDFFWGLGVECEAYIETAAGKRCQASSFYKDQRPERYSVPYYKTYKAGLYNEALKGLIDPSGTPTLLPYLLNAHSLIRVDAAGEHTTVFKKVSDETDPRGYHYELAPNPKCRKTILESLCAVDPFFKITEEVRGETFIFDGDSIEIATRDFYKTTVERTVEELTTMRREFIEHLNDAWTIAALPTTLQPLRWMTGNHPFAVLHSNPRNVSIFNNGTYHINLTMPTQLGPTAKPVDAHAFIRRHRKAARFIQWLEPFLIEAYGTADPLAKSTLMSHRFSAASQRAAASRYIGVGTFNTHTMPQGKYNTVPRKSARPAREDGWMTNYAKTASYEQLEDVGLDINFHKHYNHGLELRFFDYFPEGQLPSLIATLVQALDQSQALTTAAAPDSAIWNTLVEEVMQRGKMAIVYSWMCAELSAALGLEIRTGPVRRVWHDIQRQLERRWLGRGECSAVMIARRRYLWESVERPLGLIGPLTQIPQQQPEKKTIQAICQPQVPLMLEPGAILQIQGNPMFADRARSAHQPLLTTIPEVEPLRRGFWARVFCR